MTLVAFRVRNWSKHFENNRSRVVEKLSWIPVPNGHDSEGYATIMAHEKAAEIFTSWILILQVASRCEPRGTLLRADGTPHDSASLALRTRAKAKWFDIAIPILMQVMWLEDVAIECQSPVTRMPSACQSGDEGKKEDTTPHNTERKGAAADGRQVDFESFWECYPKKIAKADALKSFLKVKDPLPVLLAALRFQKNSAQWSKDNGQFIPNPATWLNQERWKDEGMQPRLFPGPQKVRVITTEQSVAEYDASNGANRP